MSWLVVLALIGNLWSVNSNELSLQNNLDLALRYYHDKDLETSIKYLQNALLIAPNHVDVNGVLGSIYLSKSDLVKGIQHLEISLQYGEFSNSENLANYLHGLLLSREYSKGLTVFQETVPRHSSNLRFFVNGILLYFHSERIQELYQCANQYLGSNLESWLDVMRRMNEKGYFQLSEDLGQNALNIFGENVELIFQIAVSLHFQNRFAEALQLYQLVVDLQPQKIMAVTNIGALHQALGNDDEAKRYYGIVANKLGHDAGFLNNFGLLLLQGSKEDEIEDGVKMLEQALEIDPHLEDALVNLASYYLDQCSITKAEDLYKQALAVSVAPKQVEIRLATLMSPVVSSWGQMLNERKNLITKLQDLIDRGQASEEQYKELDAIMDRIHFYIVYSGLNDRYIQESMSHVYSLCIRNLSKVSSYLSSKSIAFQMSGYLSSKSSRLKVGFVSKYFGVYEPHGMLLDGIMKYLPRSLFEVFAITRRPNEGKYLSPIVVKSSDHIIFIPLIHELAFQQISDLRLDIIIFADTLCEPTTHFLAQTRMAPLQMAFWGNPLTSGSKFIDYFISSDFMEHPYRSRLPPQDDPYTEQVVLLPGQGIWYSSPDSDDSQEIIRFLNASIAPHDETFQRKDFDLEDDWFIFFCPQSLFKLHPLFDKVLASILEESPKSHLVLTTGRKKTWTTIFIKRLTNSLGPLADRCHMIPRITSQKFFALIKLADVLLHPFPFDGSRTSADSLSVGVPFVTLPSEYLRGRMGASLLRTLNLPELVAHNMSEYIQISVRLSTDKSFFAYIKSLISNRSWLIWNDMTVPYSWTSFLARATGLSAPSWENYLTSFDLDVAKESNFRYTRERNQEAFDLRWGKETWHLDNNGIPHLPELIGESELLPMFENWKVTHESVHKAWSPTRDHLLNLAHEQAIAGNFLGAIEIESLLLKDYSNDPQIFLELGAYQYFLGNYQSALDYCEKSNRLLLSKGLSNSQVFGCIGISATYLDDEEKTVFYLNKAWELRNDLSPLSPLFTFPIKAIQMSLTTGLRTFLRFDECVDVLSTIFDLSIASRSGSFVIFSSLYQLSERTTASLQQLELELKLAGEIHSSFDAVTTIKRIQDDFDFLIVTARDCLVGYLKSHRNEAIFRSLRDSARLIDPPSNSLKLADETRIPEKSKKLILVSQYYAPPSASSSSTYDVDSALLKNLANPFISDIYLFNERKYQLDHFPNQEKIHQVVLGNRPTFENIFQFVNNYLPNKDILLANSDIYFDETLGLIGNNVEELNFQDTIFALSKWTDWEPTDNFISLSPRIDSQDAWIFRSPLNQDVVESSTFFLGAPRCDNRLASIFTQSGYKVLNPVYRIHAIELMSTSRDSGLYEMAGAPIGEALNIFLTNELPIRRVTSNNNTSVV